MGKRRRLQLLVWLLAALACTPRTVSRPPAFPLECEALPAPDDPPDTITVALFEPVDPDYAPWPRNGSERLVFHHLFETLIRIDCLGDARPGLARSWRRGDGGRRWTFELRDDARFWDGSSVSAHDVVWSWQLAAVDPMTVTAVIESTVVSGERELHVYLKQRHKEVPRELAGPAFHVAKPSEKSPFLIGTGPYRFAPDAAAGTGTLFAHSATRRRGPVIKFVSSAARDPRDLLEASADMLITDDPAVSSYAARRTQFVSVALPWTRSYILLSATRVRELWRGEDVSRIPDAFAERLARDAVRSEARAFNPPSWWDDLDVCPSLSPAVPPLMPVPRGALSPDTRRILFDDSDPVARGLAERIVALAGADPASSGDADAIADAVPDLVGSTIGTVAQAVTEDVLAASMSGGADFAYVVAIARRPQDPCYEIRRLLSRAPWLANDKVDVFDAVLPLVDTRARLIANHGQFGLVVDWFGDVMIVEKAPGR